MPGVDDLFQASQQLVDVVHVQPCGRFVNEQQGRQRPFSESRQIFYELKSLRFASGQSVQGLPEGQIPETDLLETSIFLFVLGNCRKVSAASSTVSPSTSKTESPSSLISVFRS